MKFLFTTLLLAGLCIACTNKTPTVATTTPTQPATAPAPSTPQPSQAAAAIVPRNACYRMTEGKNISVVRLNIDSIGNVNGGMAWEPFEADGARGWLKGKLQGDIITANFQYMIEGSIQTEEVMFKLVEKSIIKASAPIEEDKHGTLVIKDKSVIEWKEAFQEVDCSQVSATLRRIDMVITAIHENISIPKRKLKDIRSISPSANTHSVQTLRFQCLAAWLLSRFGICRRRNPNHLPHFERHAAHLASVNYF